MPKISSFLWFDTEAEEAARFYVSIFDNSRIGTIARYGDAGPGPKGSVMTVAFELDGQPFTALNGGPQFKFNEAISFEIECATQEDLDYFWEKLGAGGDPKAQQCGWLKDKYGVSWQVVPLGMYEMFEDSTSQATQRAMTAMLKMKKLDLAALRRAYAG
jgi:predicted 3-demethylubiquinone-9 3-methyltransferase (glyoxalase superfamily)